MTATLEPNTGTAPAQEHRFEASVREVLDIVVHSLYSNRDVFLRELISNASDALDKLKFRALTEHELMAGDKTLAIRITADRDAKTLTIEDTGIGMSAAELKVNLGTIAHSGSKKFVEEAKKSSAASAVDLIGRFGVGFYSAFLVADRVEVTSRPAGGEEAHTWASTADGTFTISPATRAARGTSIKLHLKEEHEGFLDEWKIKDLVERYSDYVSHDIFLEVERPVGGDDADADEDEDDAKDAKKERKTEKRFEKINKGTPVWTRPKSEVTDEQYTELYKHLTHDWEAPLGRTHFSIEGTQLFTGLLYIPKRPPFDLFDRKNRRGVRLYVKRVFIMDDCEELLPEWLRFVRGIVDSDDLPLNVSRELLQDSKIVRTIKKQVVKKTLELLKEMAEQKPDDYKLFWAAYGPVLKEGLHFDFEHREQIAELCRFATSKEEYASLKEYVSRMPEGQKEIYYLIGETKKALAGSPHAEALFAKGLEVIYLTDAVDEWAIEGLKTFDKKPLVSAMKANLDLGANEEAKKALDEKKEQLKTFTEALKETLKEHVSEVRLSQRLTGSPCCLVVPEGGLHAHMERLLRAHDRDVPQQKRILELNPAHAIVSSLKQLFDAGQKEKVGEWGRFLYEHALVTEGSPIEDPQGFARRMTRLMEESLSRETTVLAAAKANA